MATIKSHTDLEQSKKLAEILPTESADMIWYGIYCGTNGKYHLLSNEYNEFGVIAVNKQFDKFLFRLGDEYVDWLPCWSLAALLDVLESEIDGEEGETYQLNIEKDGTWWNVWYRELYDEANPLETESTEELIDVCVEMILKLHKLKLL